jgi:hypothetical protein
VLLFEDLAAISIDDVAKLINQVSSAVDSSLELIIQVSFLVWNRNEVTLVIFFNLTDAVSDIIASTIVVEELWKVSIRCELGLVKLFAAMIIENI